MMQDTQNLEEVVVLGIRFHKVTVEQLLNYIIQSAFLEHKTMIGNVNTRAMNFAWEFPWYKDFINTANLVFCDGFGVLLAAKMMGFSLDSRHRMTCPDYIDDLILKCEASDRSIFLLAGKPGVIDIAIEKMKATAPNLRVAGHHGYFQKTGAENDQVIEMINHFNPDILYVGFGMPTQERWLVDNLDRLNAKVFLPLGACLDFYTGTVYRGPRWMTDRGLEWLTRLVTEPNRLWKRYIVGNPLFFYRVLKHKLFNPNRQ